MESVEKIENIIAETLVGEAQENARSFVRRLLRHNLLFENGKGYWEGKPYWMVKYKNEYVCFLFIHGSPAKYEGEPEGWMIWSGENDSSWRADRLLDDQTKETAWKNVDVCGKCSPDSLCFGGSRKTVLGKTFDNVCRTTFRFDNPNAEAVECAKKLIELRMGGIDDEPSGSDHGKR